MNDITGWSKDDIIGYSNGSTTGTSEGLAQYMHYISGGERVPYVRPKEIVAIDLEGNVGRMNEKFTEEFLSRLIERARGTSKTFSLWTKNPRHIICDYHYANGTTTITWLDGTKTTCHCDPDRADQYTGFMIALAKHAFGNHNAATNLADYWINKKPEIERKAEAKRIAKEKEEARIEAKRKERRAKNRIRRAAIRRAEEYQAKKIANEKYGIPMDFKE